jgi:hypothetical protein
MRMKKHQLGIFVAIKRSSIQILLSASNSGNATLKVRCFLTSY